MRVLLDECIPKGLSRFLLGIDLKTVYQMGWAGKKDREILELMVGTGFDVLITADQGIPHQQRLEQFGVSVIIVCAPSNRLVDLVTILEPLKTCLASIQPGQIKLVTKTELP